jgi:hypothetical protein
MAVSERRSRRDGRVSKTTPVRARASDRREVKVDVAKKMTDKQLAALDPQNLRSLHARTDPAMGIWWRTLSPDGKALHDRVAHVLRMLAADHESNECEDENCPLCDFAGNDEEIDQVETERESRPLARSTRSNRDSDDAHVDRRTRGWSQVPNAFFDWKLPPEFSATCRLVYLAYNRHANGRPRRLVKYISQERIAEDTGLSRATVVRGCRFLEKISLLRKTRQGGARRGEDRETSEYRVAELSEFAADPDELFRRIRHAAAVMKADAGGRQRKNSHSAGSRRRRERELYHDDTPSRTSRTGRSR